MHVVLIDNDASLLRSLEILIGAQGHQVKAFDSAAAGGEYLRRRPKVDALIIDHVLGNATSVQVLRRLKPMNGKPVKVILISGHTDLVSDLDLNALGVNVFLPKPLDLEQLLGVLGGSGAAAPSSLSHSSAPDRNGS